MERKKELDSIRGLAAVTIVVFHLWLRHVGTLGWAVNVFFVLSGYLITSIILTNELNDHFVLTFYARRCLRIWPIYYLTLAMLVLLHPFLPIRGSLEELPFYFTYTQEITHYWSARDPTFPEAFRHTWTLAIEEQFYLLWPALLWLVGRRRLPILATALIGLAVAARALDLNHFILVTQCDGLALGGLLAWLLAERSRSGAIAPSSRLWLTVLSFALSAPLVAVVVVAKAQIAERPELRASAATESLVLLLGNLVFFAMTATVVLNAGRPWLALLRDKRLVYLGTISYGIYLYHHFIFKIWESYAVYYGWPSNLATDLAKLGASLGAAALSWRFVERPILALKDRFPYQRVAQRELSVPGDVGELGGMETG
jgi:peptidoglycan/LPS O-acetylase OafA/YrhL